MLVTVDDLRGRLRGYFDDLYPDFAVAEQDLECAQAEVDGYAAVRYTLPLQPNRLAAGWVMTLAEELAWSRQSSGKLPDNVKARVDNTRQQLGMLADGKLVLPNQQESTDTGGGCVLIAVDEPEFTRDKMAGY